ncbi:MAG: hypothetical protein M0Z89_02395 [Nitrospiraceae bacterium]|nr:hypothetical protein [Nitrospiraceae bacterium]
MTINFVTGLVLIRVLENIMFSQLPLPLAVVGVGALLGFWGIRTIPVSENRNWKRSKRSS